MKSTLLQLVLCGFVTVLLASPTAGAQQQELLTADHELTRLNAEEVTAFLHKDADAISRLWSDSFVLTNAPNDFVNKDDALQMVRSGYLVITSYDRRMEYLRIVGDVAIVAGSETVTWGGKMRNAGNTEELRFTGIWMKQQGRWQEIARHASVVPNPLVSYKN